MNSIANQDRLILRNLAYKKLNHALSDQNKEILQKWKNLSERKRDSPTVRLLFSNFQNEVIGSRISCTDARARKIEWTLLQSMVGRELFNDDTPVSDTFDITWQTTVSPFGLKPHTVHANGTMGFHIEPVIHDLTTELDKLRGGFFHVNREATKVYFDTVQDILGDILTVRMTMGSLSGALTSPLVYLMGMENFFYAMIDCPAQLHEAMDLACSVYERFYDYLEQEQLLLPTNGISSVSQESFAFTNELPADHVTKTTECWGFLESQETTAVSPEMYGEFVYPYQDRLVRRFGLLSYGCCERVDDLFENYLSKWDKLRRLSVSPFNQEERIGSYLRGTGIIYYSKPRAEYVTNPGPLDEEAIRECFKKIAQAASGCLLEIAQREVGTIYGDFERGRRYVQLAKETISEYWKP